MSHSSFAPLIARAQPAAQILLAALQTKPALGPAYDAYEREADRVADQVVSIPESGLAGRPASTSHARPGVIQRACALCSQEEDADLHALAGSGLQRKVLDGRSSAGSLAASAVNDSLRAGGQTLPRAERDYFEPRFGVDFSQVRIHHDAAAAAAADAVGARAFALGRDLVFARGEYAPATLTGKRLLAHELTHVLQQGGASRQRAPRSVASRTGLPSAIRHVGAPTIQAQPAEASPQHIFASVTMCPATKVVYLGQKQEGDNTNYKAHFEVHAGTRACRVFVHFDDPHDEDATREDQRMFELLLQASSGRIKKVCVKFDSRVGDPECNDPREVEDVWLP
ncbi:DUF4157 domain-containing protein [Comamonadaceae bacterium G21597-S1]|nr:DUF4157 domain-containing protein [Comamonadaceae bacterium G21597-S1]